MKRSTLPLVRGMIIDTNGTSQTRGTRGRCRTLATGILEGDLKGADGPASVFIDIVGLPFTPLSFAGATRRTGRRAAMYYAAAHSYYGYPPPPYYPPAYYAPPRCVYYPLPPCY